MTRVGAGSGTRGAEPPSAPVYAIADVATLEAADVGSIPEAVAAMARGGADWIQLRAKRLPDGRFYEIAVECAEVLRQAPARLWIDDRPDIAALVGARLDEGDLHPGVHLGQSDLPPQAVRRVLGKGVWIGHSTHDREQLLAADRDPAVDVIALGPVFPTGTKEDPDPVIGLETVRWARGATDKPLVAIGGIDGSNVADVLAAGADAAAVISAICRGGDVEENVRRLTAAARTGAAARR